MKKRTKLKDMKLTSVDLVRRGANQEADICFYKSADYQEDDIVKGLYQAKESCIEAIDSSLDSIMQDSTMDTVEKAEMALESLEQFYGAMTDIFKNLTNNAEPEGHEAPFDEEGAENMRIDKSRFSPEELYQYNALIAKGKVEDDEEGYVPEVDEAEKAAVEDEEYEYEPEEEETEKALHPAVKKALEEVEELKKNYEMQALHEVAKKYAPLGKKEEELADTLYEMKKSSDYVYNSYIAALDEQLEFVNKSGLFTEIGKSRAGVAGGNVVAKIESIATDIQKSMPELSRVEAVQKAWDNNPELLEEYENEYMGGR